jgi:hypothetical protein
MMFSTPVMVPARSLAEAKVAFLRKDGTLLESDIADIQRFLDSVLDLWKIEHGDSSPAIGGGLLGNIPIAFEDAKPWQCVPNEQHDATSLLLKLWDAEYKPLRDVQLTETIFLAALILREDVRWGDAYSRFRAIRDAEETRERERSGKVIDALGPLAIHGKKFKEHEGTIRKPGLIRGAIVKLLAKYPEMKNPELWEAIKKKPPRGWQAFESVQLGKYLEGPTPSDGMKYGRFCTICGQERNKLEKK